jgi:NDP-sugar pyrophosphorylase family protein
MPMHDDARAIIMAGGRSERMRATAGPLHKALVPVLGVPMLERNLRVLLSEGFRDIVVAISKAEPQIGEFLDTALRPIAESHGAHVRILWEDRPLGTIGAAREAIAAAETLLVVNVDNLTALPLGAFVAFHREQDAALTIAAHEEHFQIPFGELDFCGHRVRRYIEKPVKPIWISSGTYVLSPDACEFIPRGQRTDVPQLVAALLAAGKHVAAFRHDSAWIDVNHAEAIKTAETMIGHPARP